jgi:predicted Zn-dependent protease
MDHKRFYRPAPIILVGLLFFCGGCATVNVPNMGSKDYFIEADEQRIINRSNEIIEAIDTSGYLYSDVDLEKYLNDVAQRLVPSDLKIDPKIRIQIKVLSDPTMNAFAFTNGAIYVHTGMLAAAGSEAQIASILGHEMTHVYHRHTLKQFRSLKNSSAFWSTIGLPLDVFSGGLASLLGQLSFLSSVSGFSQSHEFEADEGGFALIKEYGYDTVESAKVFERLAEFTEDEELKEPFFFSTHPRVLERVKKFKELNAAAKPVSGTSEINRDEFLKMTRKLRLDNIDMCLEKGFYRTADKNIEFYLSLYPQDAQGWFRQGELFRRRQDPPAKIKKRDKTDDFTKALEIYQKTLVLDPAMSGAWLGQARVLQKISKTEEAKMSFRKYLELEPDSRERPYIEQLINSGVLEKSE